MSALTPSISRWLVGSSSIMIWGVFHTNILKATLLFWPPLHLYIGRSYMSPWIPNLARWPRYFSTTSPGKAFCSCSKGDSFSSSWSIWCWVNTEILSLGCFYWYPSERLTVPVSSFNKVDFPHPLGPTRAIL